MPETEAHDRYVVISTDGHCGADLQAYRPYLESRYREEFDAWAADYADAWSEVDQQPDGERRIGVASGTDPVNWDSDLRQSALEEQGIAAEMLFPNTTPPF